MARPQGLLLAIVAAFSLVSCSDTSPADPNLTNSATTEARGGQVTEVASVYPALAGDFATLEQRYPRQDFYPAQYYDAKLAAALDARDSAAGSYVSDAGPFGEPNLDLADCSEGIPESHYGPDPEVRFAELAIRVADLESRFRSSRYREEVFQEPLLEYEREMLELFGRMPADQGDEAQGADNEHLTALRDEIERSLVSRAEDRRSRLQPDQPKLTLEGGCGGGEAPVLIHAAPANGRIWMVSAFNFYRCSRRSSDPWRRDACRWEEALRQRPMLLSGRWYYQAEWPDGHSKRGNHTFAYVEEPSGEAPVIMVSR